MDDRCERAEGSVPAGVGRPAGSHELGCGATGRKAHGETPSYQQGSCLMVVGVGNGCWRTWWPLPRGPGASLRGCGWEDGPLPGGMATGLVELCGSTWGSRGEALLPAPRWEWGTQTLHRLHPSLGSDLPPTSAQTRDPILAYMLLPVPSQSNPSALPVGDNFRLRWMVKPAQQPSALRTCSGILGSRAGPYAGVSLGAQRLWAVRGQVSPSGRGL